MNPFHFGPSDRALFGVHHPPHRDARDPRGRGVVLLYPVGGEYLRAHRAFRQLTTLLVRAGLHVLRFDYSGTGDSAGEPRDASWEGWAGDAGAAVEELREAAGLETVALAGLRLGANLALATARVRDDVRQVVLWDPVEDGAAYLASLDWVEVEGRVPAGARDPERDHPALGYPAGTRGSGGFPYVPSLARAIEVLRLGSDPVPRVPADVLVSSERPEARAVVERWQRDGATVSYRSIPSESDWARGDRFGSALIPGSIIQGVVDRLTREDAR
jgi:uncharacterized protein